MVVFQWSRLGRLGAPFVTTCPRGDDMIRTVLLSFMLIAPAWAQTRELNLQPTDGWVDTGIDLKAGDTVKTTARGHRQSTSARQANGPEGLPRGFADLVRVFQLNEAGRGTLIGRIGSSDADRPFQVGTSLSRQARVGGRRFRS